MKLKSDGTEPAVRPLIETEIPATPRPTSGRRRLVAVAAGALAVGFILGATSWRLTPATPDASTSPQSSFADDGPSPPGSTSPVDEAAPDTTATTTTLPRQTLGVLVPAMEGRTLVGSGAYGGFRWASTSNTPSIFDTGADDSYSTWDATGTYALVTKHIDEAGWGELWVFTGSQTQPVFLDVQSVLWHPSKPQIAFTGRTTPGAATELFVALVGPYGAEITEEMPLPPPAPDETAWLRSWGDWGFAFGVDACNQSGCTSRVVTLDQRGALLGEADGSWIATVSPTGRMLLTDEAAMHEAPSGFRWTDPGLATFEPADLPDTAQVWGIQWTPDGSAFSFTFDPGSGRDAETWVVTGDERKLLGGAQWVYGFSQDGRLVAAHPDGVSQRTVAIVDLDTGARAEVKLPWDVWDVRIGDL